MGSALGARFSEPLSLLSVQKTASSSTATPPGWLTFAAITVGAAHPHFEHRKIALSRGGSTDVK